MEGPYEDYKEPDKVAVILGWLGNKGHQVYASIDWTTLGKDQKLYKDVLFMDFNITLDLCKLIIDSVQGLVGSCTMMSERVI